MKANELMIGDWVSCITTGEYHQIYRLNIGDRYIADDGLYAQYPDIINLLSDVEGIPLTEEILRVNGFIDKNATNGISFRWYVLQTNQEYGDVWGRTNQTIAVAWREYNSDVYVNRPYGTSTQQKISVADIKYVHELQHALRLCGLNDLADNFKVPA